VSITPFGSPVVPDVYMIVARSSGWGCAESGFQRAFLPPDLLQLGKGRHGGVFLLFLPVPRRLEHDQSRTLFSFERVERRLDAAKLFGVRDEEYPRAAVPQDESDLVYGLGRVYWHVDRPVGQNRIIGNAPLGTAFGQQRQAVSRANPEIMKGEGQISHPLIQLRARDVLPPPVALVTHHDLIGVFAHRLVEQLVDGLRRCSSIHLFIRFVVSPNSWIAKPSPVVNGADRTAPGGARGIIKLFY
jgi:hypothetical protein